MSTLLTDIASAASVHVLAAGALTATGNGTGVDLGDGDGPCTLVHHVVAAGGTSPDLVAVLAESDNNSSGWSEIPAEIDEVSAAGDLQIVQFFRTKRYVRYTRTITGTSPSFTVSVLALQQKKMIA